ncbi:MAG: 50S ribosomal protein L24 [Deltaproteobacteria bacterium]|nr:50S ribosomal protein L24 [Deltaproteobacteria bacterium]
MLAKLHFKKDDQAIVIAGKEKGKSGKILSMISKKECVLIEKVNLVKRHSRPSAKNRQGGIIEKEAPIHISNVMILCSKCNSPVRIGRKTLEDGKKVRYCKKCGEFIDL